ncbi:MAG TPA: peroxiredoxin, partial [bacterium]
MSVLVAKEAPLFTAPAVMPDGTIRNDFSLSELRGKTIVLFFWPLDFSFVCPTEILAHEHRFDAFKKKGVELIGVSIDSQYTHYTWRNVPVKEGGIGPVRFPLVADVKHEIARAYGVEHPDGVALRASFLIDREGIVQHQVVNNLSLGRNADEMLRMVDALQFFEKNGDVCPAGWQQGQSGMKAT